MSHSNEIADGERFAFGKNWLNFLNNLSEERIQLAEQSLKEMLDLVTLEGKTFLDVGSGSGLFSLAAKRLGAHVHSFDYDPQSVACTAELRKRYFPGCLTWMIQEGSVLDTDYLSKLDQFDIVYSWGVLHHTGDMWSALNNLIPLTKKSGQIYIAIYNSSAYSRRWRLVKHTYCRMPRYLKFLFALSIIVPIQVNTMAKAAIRLKLSEYVSEIRHYKKQRGMSWWHDQIDWLGGYPYETAKPEEIFYLFKERGCQLEKLVTCGGGTGCNHFVLSKQ